MILKHFVLSMAVIIVLFTSCSVNYNNPNDPFESHVSCPGGICAQWAKTVVSGSAPNYSEFFSVAVDTSGNIYAAGYIEGSNQFDFGNGQTATGVFSGAIGYNVIIVKYNSSGVAQWAKTVAPGSANNFSAFYSAAVDTSGNIYAAGVIEGSSQFDFGNGQTATGASTGGNIILVKYNSSGVTQWAKTVAPGSANNNSCFNSVSLDANGNIYVAGYITGNTQFDFGNSQTATGVDSGVNIILVKYNSSGVAQWASTVAPGSASDYSEFFSVAVDTSSNIYAAGYIYGNTQFDFGNSKTATGVCSSGSNIILVKYNSSGVAQWAQTVAPGSANNESSFSSVAVDINGVYVVGLIVGSTQFDFGNSKTATGASTGENIILVKYDSSGAAQLAKTVAPDSANNNSYFNSVSLDVNGNIYAAGGIEGSSQFDFGNSQTATGVNSGVNIILVKYNSSGVAQWASTVAPGSASDYSEFFSVAVDTSSNIYAAGYITGSNQFNFGNATATGVCSTGNNVVLVKY